MRCKYCFYADEMSNRERGSYGIMTLETLEAVVKKAIEASRRDGFVGFMFQGGEPTLAGLDFYRALVELIKKYNTYGLRVNLGLQTNGYAITEEWAAFLAEHNFLVGLSLDGTKEIHNLNRLDAEGKGTFGKVMHAAELFRKHGVAFNTVTVVTEKTARSITSIYNFLKSNELTWQQYIPCLDPLGCSEDKYLTAEQYGEFLCRLFDLWYVDMRKGKYVYNRTFENYVGIIMGRHPEECGMCGFCTVQYVLEADGGVFPCDFYVLDDYKLGNFVTDSIEQINQRAKELGFVEVSRNLREECKSCKWVALCRGGCRRYREPFEDGAPSLNKFCTAYKKFFDHSADRLIELARIAARRR
jgi:uncharacterized protein